jgi:hypothetical protein
VPETWASEGHALACRQEVKDHLYDRNMPLSCDNVELRGFEPLTSCMPCLAVSSGGVSLGRSYVTQRMRMPTVTWANDR